MAQVVEEVLVQEFIAHPAIERFNEPVLHGLARGDVVPLNVSVFLPFQDRIAGQLRAVAFWE